MNGFEWSSDLVEILIFLWQQHEVLYQVNHQDFRNKEKRNNAICSIYRELKKLNDDITLVEIRSKINDLCAQFAEEFRQKNTEDGTNPRHGPNLWCYDQLRFLEDRVLDTSSKPKVDTIILNPTRKSSILIQNTLQPLQNILKRRLENKYDWLGEQVVFKMSKIQDENIRETTAREIKYSLENIDQSNDNISNGNDDENVGDDIILNNHTKKDSSKKIKKNNANEEIELTGLQKQVMALKQLIVNNFETETARLGKLVSEKISKINDGRVREESAWTIQCILYENVKKDRMLRQGNQQN